MCFCGRKWDWNIFLTLHLEPFEFWFFRTERRYQFDGFVWSSSWSSSYAGTRMVKSCGTSIPVGRKRLWIFHAFLVLLQKCTEWYCIPSKENQGDCQMFLQVGKNYLCQEWKQELITFSQFLERIQGKDGSSGVPTYLAQHPLFDQACSNLLILSSLGCNFV